MAIKIRNTDKKSMLRRLSLPIITDNTATGGDTSVIITPCKCKLEKIAFCCGVGVSACAGDALHTVVSVPAQSLTLIDNTITGTVSAIVASAVIAITPTADSWISALSRVVFNFSASSIVGTIRCHARFLIDEKDEK